MKPCPEDEGTGNDLTIFNTQGKEAEKPGSGAVEQS
jgi:hypothetical protein